MAGGYSVTFTVVDQATKQIDAINRRIAAMRAPLERMSRQVSRFVDVSGLRKVAQGFEWIGKAAANVFRSLSAIVPVMGAITGAASIAGMVKLVSVYADWSHALVQAADNIGITTQELQRFEDATRLAGGNANDMREGLKGLHDRLADLNIGRGSFAETAQMLNYLGINARDANGHLRTAADLMPEVIAKIGALKDPADRARIATGLLGGEGDKLVETFRQSSQTFAQWFTDVSRYKNLTDEQKRSLQLFGEAQGRVGVAFDHLGQQIAVLIAQYLTPLFNKFSQFVEQNTPAIVGAVKDIGDSFAALWQSIAGDVSGDDAIKTLRDNIKAIVDDLKWLVDKGNDFAAVLNRLANIHSWHDLVTPIVPPSQGGTAEGYGPPGAATPAAPASPAPPGPGGAEPATPGVGPHHGQNPPAQGNVRGGGPRVPSNLSLPENTAARSGAIAASLSTDLNLPATSAAGIVGNLQAESGLKAINEKNPLVAGSRGGFGWAQWTGPRRREFEAFAKENNLDPKSDAANYGFLVHELQSRQFAPMLEKLRNLKGPNAARDAAALVEKIYEGPAVSNAGVRGRYADDILKHLPAAAAPPVTVPGPAPVNGAVDVSITHKNAPPNSAVTATGSGSVNVAPVRVEHQDMASI